MPTYVSSCAASALVSTLTTHMNAGPWTTISAGTWHATTAAGTLKIASISASNSTLTINTHLSGVATNKAFYINHGSTQASGVVYYTLSVGADYFYLSVEGPKAGTYGAASAASGSYKDSFFIGTYTLASGLAEPTSRIVVVGSEFSAYNSNSTSAYVQYSYSSSTAAWTAANLVTLLPAVSGTGVSAAVNNDSSVVVFPFQVHEIGSVSHGQIDKLFYCDADPTPTDGTFFPYLNRRLVRQSGEKYQVVGWAKVGASIQRPVGLSESVTVAGPGSPAVAVPVTP